MELNEILNYIFGGTSLVGLVTTVIFWNKSKRKEEAETQKSESEAEQADIATQMVELVKSALDRSDGNQEVVMSQLNIMDLNKL